MESEEYAKFKEFKKTAHLPKRVELLEHADDIEAAFRKHCYKDFMCFARGLIIASQNGPCMFETCMADFQREFFEDIAPALHAIQAGKKPDIRRFWVERTKKAGKDSDLAVIMLWLVAFSYKPLFMQVGAADGEQAGIVKDRIEHLLHWNPWLNDYVCIVTNQIRSKKTNATGRPLAVIVILKSDTSGSHGATPDVLIINELSHIVKWEFVENLMDNADGVAKGLVVIATNAGIKGTKAHVWRRTAIASEAWSVHCLSAPAPWHDKGTIAEARKRNTLSRYDRLWRGRWTSGKGDALREEDIEAAFVRSGPLPGPEQGWMYIAGLDIGISHDHSGFVVVGIHRTQQKLRLAVMKAWEPLQATGEVDLQDVEDNCHAFCKIFNVHALYYDPAQAKLMHQRLRRKGVNTQEMTFTPKNLSKMAEYFMQAIENQKLECYDDEDGRLRRDFGKFNIADKTYGYKLEAVSDEFGHADVGTAVVICMPPAFEYLEGKRGLESDEDIVDMDDNELTEDEIEGMPDELRDIYGIDDDSSVRGPQKRVSLSSDDPFYDL